MKLTTERLKKLIREEIQKINENEYMSNREVERKMKRHDPVDARKHEQDVMRFMRSHNYAPIGRFSLGRSSREYPNGQYGMNNGVIGVVPPTEDSGLMYFRKSGTSQENEKALLAILDFLDKEMDYDQTNLPLKGSHRSEETLMKMANFRA